jgi:hypothetical protein
LSQELAHASKLCLGLVGTFPYHHPRSYDLFCTTWHPSIACFSEEEIQTCLAITDYLFLLPDAVIDVIVQRACIAARGDRPRPPPLVQPAHQVLLDRRLSDMKSCLDRIPGGHWALARGTHTPTCEVDMEIAATWGHGDQVLAARRVGVPWGLVLPDRQGGQLPFYHALVGAARGGHLDLLQRLAAADADRGKPDDMPSARRRLCVVWEAARNGDVAMLHWCTQRWPWLAANPHLYASPFVAVRTPCWRPLINHTPSHIHVAAEMRRPAHLSLPHPRCCRRLRQS